MPTRSRPGHAWVAFDAVAWAHDLARLTPEARRVAKATRARLERNGQPVGELRPCEVEGREGTSLPGCVKIYIPPPAGPWGVVFLIAVDEASGKPQLDYLAFGLRHPPEGRRRSVYQLAHERMRGLQAFEGLIRSHERHAVRPPSLTATRRA